MAKQSKYTKQRVATSIIVLFVIALLGLCSKALVKKPDQLSGNPDSLASTAANMPNADSYKDGTYMAAGVYNSPGGQQQIQVSLTISNNSVSAATVQSLANDGVAQQYQADFVSGFKPYVVGKKLNNIKVSRVSGSSLTSQGFNNAVVQIKNQAKT